MSLSDAAVKALLELFEEDVLLFHRLTALAERIHGQGGLSAARRGVLRSLERLGPQTVPQLARARPVSRQLIQTLVNALRREGYVALGPNPAHRRSKLVRLTRAGRGLLAAMYRRERRYLRRLTDAPGAPEVEAAGRTLARLREALSGPAARRRRSRGTRGHRRSE